MAQTTDNIFTKTSTTSVIAVMIVVLGMGLLYLITGAGVPKDDTTRTQIVQGVFGLLMMLAGYYFGASKQRTSTQAGTTTADISATVTTTDKPDNAI